MRSAKKVSTDQVWNELLDIQVRLTQAGTVQYFKTLPEFQKAQTVLEIGSGNGSFLSSLADAFPRTSFQGIDVSRSHVRVARQRAAYRTNLRFSIQDLYDGTDLPKVDFIIARLVVQHLRDLPTFLDVCNRALRPGGHLLIIEVDNDGVALFPPAPEAQRVFQGVRLQQKFGGPAGALKVLAKNSARFSFSPVHDRVVVHHQRPQSKDSTRTLWTHYAYLAEQVWGISVNWHRIERDLSAWRANSASTSQFNCRHVLYQKQSGLRRLWSQITFSGGRRASR